MENVTEQNRNNDAAQGGSKTASQCRTVRYVRCHGSSNRFVMVDGVAEADALAGVDLGRLSRRVCDSRCATGGADGLLVFAAGEGGYAMRMFNPDGSQAEMCGNGIRCVARLAADLLHADEFTLFSGGRPYRITRGEPIGEGLATFGVEIGVATSGPDFGFFGPDETFVGKVIAPLDGELRFTALNLGNPHVTACVERIDMELLRRLGERVKQLPGVFPHGVNVSLYECGPDGLFVATYERGAGITSSCGTAMTASATAAALLGLIPFGAEVDVRNSGGMVRCLPEREAGGALRTRLTGNATCEFSGSLRIDASGEVLDATVGERYDAETEAYARFAASVKRD